MSTQIANFASCLGKYDGSMLYGAGTTFDPSAIAIGNSDLSLNSGYLLNPNPFTTPAISAGNNTGFSVTGWFNPSGAQASNYTPVFDMSGASATATNHITLCVSGNSVTPVLVANFINQAQVYVPAGSVNANAWNFFGYTVCCSGGTQLVQNLTVNGTTTSVTGGTYSALTVANTYVGYGVTLYNNYFNGKVDDFRYYARILCPMEMRVLYGYAYGKSSGMIGTNITPMLGTVIIGTNQATIPITFSTTGTFSYVQVSRTSGGMTLAFIVNASQLVQSGSNYVWTDTTVLQGANYTYVVTPYILGSTGIPSLPSTVLALAPPMAVSVVGTGTDSTHFTLAFTGGTNAYSVVTYTYNINGQGFGQGYTTSSSTSQTPTVTLLSRTGSYTAPWTVVVRATNTVGYVDSSTSASFTYFPQPVIWYKFETGDQVGLNLYNWETGLYDASFTTTNMISTTRFSTGSASCYFDGTQSINIKPSILATNSNAVTAGFNSTGWTPKNTLGYTFTTWFYNTGNDWGGAMFEFIANSDHTVAIVPQDRCIQLLSAPRLGGEWPGTQYVDVFCIGISGRFREYIDCSYPVCVWKWGGLVLQCHHSSNE